ncbi:hypothetical protein GW7_20950 [Heterocephalus glaber]|uniref:Uncharacterized protein n=1 Tax=Heterocephalus glaber TaxID=10181 RepID=G5ARL9_HETGA|nr:hypothetical protein GW7_20950 [Heterocephalus glaber]
MKPSRCLEPGQAALALHLPLRISKGILGEKPSVGPRAGCEARTIQAPSQEEQPRLSGGIQECNACDIYPTPHRTICPAANTLGKGLLVQILIIFAEQVVAAILAFRGAAVVRLCMTTVEVALCGVQ